MSNLLRSLFFAVFLLWLVQSLPRPALSQSYDPAMTPGTTLVDIPDAPGKMIDNQGRSPLLYRDDYHQLGWQYHLFKLHVPTAWTITKGKSSTILDIDDKFLLLDHTTDEAAAKILLEGYVRNFKNPDLTWRKKGTSIGNFIWIAEDAYYNNNMTTADSLVSQNIGSSYLHANGLTYAGTPVLYGDAQDDGHGTGVFSIALAEENGRGMVGVSPKCSGILTASDVLAYDSIDVNPSASGIQAPDVLSTSRAFGDRQRMKAAIDAGIVVVGNSANDLLTYAYSITATCNGVSKTFVAPKVIYPGAYAWDGNNNRAKDIKVICVSRILDSEFHDGSCWYFGQAHGDQFSNEYNYSPGREKFPALNDAARTSKREYAQIDVVVYANEMNIAFDEAKRDAPEQSVQYRRGDAATSEATPQVAGIIGLMRSINKYLSVPLNGSGIPTDKADVHRKAYDILTFTARKAKDTTFPANKMHGDWHLPGDSCWRASYFPTASPVSFPLDYPTDVTNASIADFGYAVQINDRLQRSWCRRMGFGVVDAYRCVAHAIHKKGNYAYNTNTTLSGDAGSEYKNEDGKELIHFGSKIKRNGTELNVLDSGGVAFPGDPDSLIRNNNGETLINRTKPTNSATILTVSTDVVLAIDGILRQTDASRENNKIKTTGTGKILMSGYLDDVELVGNTELSDMEIHSTGSSGTPKGGITIDSSGHSAKITGAVILKDNGEITLTAGVLRLAAGGSVAMQGNKDIHVQNGATLVMDYPSRISGNSGCKLVVESGGTLIIRKKPSSDTLYKTELLCSVEIESGGTLQVDSMAFVKFADITKDVGATINLAATARIDANNNSGYFSTATKKYGTSTFTGNDSLSFHGGSITLAPMSTLDLNGNKGITIRSGETLVVEYPATIKGKKSNPITVEPGGLLLFKGSSYSPNSRFAATMVSVPIILKRTPFVLGTGGGCILDTNAVVSLDSFMVNVQGYFLCKPGSWLMLSRYATNNYYCEGTFRVDVTSATQSRVLVSGLKSCGAYSDFARLKIGGYCGYFDAKYTDFRNVAVEIDRVTIAPIAYCTFRSDRQEMKAAKRSIPAMLKITGTKLDASIAGAKLSMIKYLVANTGAPDTTHYELIPPAAACTGSIKSTAEIHHCLFEDLAGDVDLYEPFDHYRVKDEYPIGGVTVSRLDYVKTHENLYRYLEHGVAADYIARLDVEQDTFSTSTYGLRVMTCSETHVCRNVIEKTEFGTVFVHTAPVSLYNNLYTNIGDGIHTEAVSLANVRNNTFTDFLSAIWVTSSTISMTSKATAKSGINGYNRFNFDFTQNCDFLSNPERDNNGNIISRDNFARDINFRGEDSDILFPCGFNLFSSASLVHLWNRDAKEGSPHIETMQVQYNQWRNNSALSNVRLVDSNAAISHIIVQGTPRNISYTCGVACSLTVPDDHGCGADTLPHAPCDDDPYTNAGDWTTMDSNKVLYLDTAFRQSRIMIADTAMTAPCRTVKFYDVVQAAILGDSAVTKLRILTQDFALLAQDVRTPVALKPLALFMKGEIHEILNEPDSALAAYSSVMVSYNTSAHAMYAAWRVQYIEAELADTAHGDLYDSLISAYDARVATDMRRQTDSSIIRYLRQGSNEPNNWKGAAKAGSTTILEQNTPNPYSEETNIGYTLSGDGYVRLTVSDALGNVLAVLVDGMQKAGRYAVPFRSRILSNGVYSYHLETDKGTLSRSMVILK